jgi:hypothetical protein
MLNRLSTYLLTAFILANISSCQSSTKQKGTAKSSTSDFFNQISQLDEFKQENKRIDSIKKSSQIQVSVEVEIVNSSFLDEDKGKNIALAFINEKSPFDSKIIYTVKFDKDKKKIIAVNKNEKQVEKPEFTKPEDIHLPQIKKK